MVEGSPAAPPGLGSELELMRERAYGDSLVRIWRREQGR